MTVVILILIYLVAGSMIKHSIRQEKKNPPVRRYIPTLTPTNTPTPTPQRRIYKGFVSHYSRAGCLGCRKDLLMANGEELKDDRATIAFNWLPLNTRVKITNTDNGKSIEAVITDTGGFNKLNRIADLTPVVANYLQTKTDRSVVVIQEL